MNIDKQIADLKIALGTFQNLEKSQETTFNEAMETANDMEDGEQKDWLLSSLKKAKGGDLTSTDFLNQMKSRGYGS